MGGGGGGAGGGCWVVDFTNGLPGACSICFNTVATHQSFFLNSLTNEKGVTYNMV